MVNPLPVWKRIFDFCLAICLSVFFLPLAVLISLFILIVSPGPIFYRQTRIGYLGKPFTFWKFRTMHVQSSDNIHENYMKQIISAEHNADIPMKKLDFANDPRIIPFGKILRQSCIDELPQLLNVLRGEMSIVGPRPCLPYEASEYQQWHTRRFEGMPGITGSWQVNGKNKTTFKEMIRLDISYCQRKSIWKDVAIVFKTIPAIIEYAREGLRERKTKKRA